MIALGICDGQVGQIEHCHEIILQRCEQEGNKQSNVRRALADFLHSPEQPGPKSLNPPNVLAAESQAITLGRKKVNFVKFNGSGERIAMLIEGEQDFGLVVFGIHGHLIKKEKNLTGGALGWVTQVKWSHFQQAERELIGLCSYEKLVVVDAVDELKVVLTIDSGRLDIDKFLCF
jgi:hypothetical protein